jgi:quercetin dioxygenase-like cupin family protein
MSVDGPLTNLGRALPKETRMNDIAKGNLLGMVGYQEGAVVSRTLVDKKSGTVTLFAFAQGQGLSEHTAPFDALVQLLEGEAEITVSGTPFRLGPGEVIVMPANEPHALRALRPFKMMLTMIRS